MALLCNVDIGPNDILKILPKDKKGLNNIKIEERLFSVSKINPGNVRRFQPSNDKYHGPIP